eukprot:TRINITY_DN2375_c0_g1_i1.p2 TRINITY_DN2375_c0_g1~~TRINITY_DN2375_c0_g1_i1.p2  ORF type:complete len:142 (-),score=55.13 TRINITY_DN2375_c0_g1_i1:594-1019(-)
MHSTDVAKLLVEMGQTKTADIDVNDRSDHNRSTALSRAAHRGDRGEVERLLRAGADKSIASKSGWLPYHNAIMQLVHMRQKLRGADTHDSGGGASGAVLPGFEGTSVLLLLPPRAHDMMPLRQSTRMAAADTSCCAATFRK